MVVMAYDRPLPLRAPGRRAGRHWAEADRPAASARRRDATATDKTFLHVIEAACVEVVDIGVQGTGAHERIHPGLLIEENGGAAADLVGVVAPDDAVTRRRVVGVTDGREQHQMDVAQCIGGEDYEIAGLLEFAAGGIDISHALGPLLRGIEVYLHDARVGAYLDVLLLSGKRDDCEMR